MCDICEKTLGKDEPHHGAEDTQPQSMNGLVQELINADLQIEEHARDVLIATEIGAELLEENDLLESQLAEAQEKLAAAEDMFAEIQLVSALIINS